MVNFKAGTLSSLSANLSNFPLPVIKEYSKFNKLWKSAVSKAESVKTTLVQYDPFFILSQFSVSEV